MRLKMVKQMRQTAMKQLPKWRRASLLVMSLGCMILMACGSERSLVEEETPTVVDDTIPPLVLKEQSVTVELPTDADQAYVDGLTVVNAYGEDSLSAGKQAVRASTVGKVDYLSSVKVPARGLMLQYVMDKKGGIPMCAIGLNNEAKLRITPQSTALTILMTTPELITSNLQEYQRTVALLSSLTAYQEYVAKIAEAINKGLKHGYCPDLHQISYQRVLIEMAKKVMQNAEVPQSAISISDINRADGQVSFKLSNDYKRVLHIYYRRAWMSSNNLVIAREEPFVTPDMSPGLPEVLEPQASNYWKIVSDTWKGERGSIYKSETQIALPSIGDADKLLVDVYGIGKMDKAWDTYSTEEKQRIILAYLHSGYNDFLKPLIDLALGIKDVANASGSDNYRYDLRYGARKYPLWGLFRELGKNFLTDPKEIPEFAKHNRNRDLLGMLKQFGFYSADQILGNKQDEATKARYHNYLYNAYKNYLGVSATPQAFRAQLKGVWNNVSKLHNFADQVIKVSEISLDLAGATYAFSNSNAITTFVVDREADVKFTKLSPEDDFDASGGNVTFSWELYQGSRLGNPVYDLVIYYNNGNATVKREVEGITTTQITVNIREHEGYKNATSIQWQVIARHAKNKDMVTAKSELRGFASLPEGVVITNGELIKWPNTAIPEDGRVVIPSSVTSIKENAFLSCSRLKSVVIPNTVKSIGKDAFHGCSNLTSVTLPNALTVIEDYTFYGCSKLMEITIPNTVKRIGKGAFYGCLLVNVTIPNSVTSIGNGAFANTYLSSVVIPNSVKDLGEEVFVNSKITSITLPNTLISVPKRLCVGCNGLTKVTIPNSVVTIEESAFSTCLSLREVVLSNSLVRIEQDAFFNAIVKRIVLPSSIRFIGVRALPVSSLVELRCNAITPPDFNVYTSGSYYYYSGKLIVPRGSKELYEKTYPWNKSNPIVEE